MRDVNLNNIINKVQDPNASNVDFFSVSMIRVYQHYDIHDETVALLHNEGTNKEKKCNQIITPKSKLLDKDSCMVTEKKNQ